MTLQQYVSLNLRPVSIDDSDLLQLLEVSVRDPYVRRPSTLDHSEYLLLDESPLTVEQLAAII